MSFSFSTDFSRRTTMEEDLTIPQDSAKNCNISVIEDEREKVKDFVFRHFRETTDGPLLVDHPNSARKERPTLNKGHCKIQQGAVFSGKILSFGCSVCKDDSTYSPNDLLKHFQAAHKGTLPTYPCELCRFVTNEFPVLQRHRIEHRNTLVTCELCNDGVQYSLLLLTRHYIMCHSVNGQFDCDWCEFTTVDAGTFVQHIHHHNESPWKCSKCNHISLNEEDHQKHMKAHSGLYPYTCQDCGYGSVRSEYLKKHVAAVHKEKSERKIAWKASEEDGAPVNSSANLKLLLKKSPVESQDPQKISNLNSLLGGLPNQNGRLLKSDVPSEEIQQLLDGTTAKKDNRNSNKGGHSGEQSMLEMLQECDGSVNSDTAGHITPNGLTVLMVKNKISLPPNCTTKVMGFKMVDGKKHLVLKVIPAAKQDSPPQNHSLVEDAGSSLEKSKDTIDNGECSNVRSSLHCFAVSPRAGSCTPTDQDEILAVKVKVEEEETAVCGFDLSPHEGDVREPTSPSLNRSSACADTVYPMTNEFNRDINACHQIHSTCSERKTLGSLVSTSCNAAGLAFQLKAAQETFSEPDIKNCGAADRTLLSEMVANRSLTNKCKGSSSCNTTPEKTERESRHKNNHNLKTLLTNPVLESSSENHTQNSPNQEVFTFHNYSKEILSTSPNTSQTFDSMSDISDKESMYESSQFSLTLAESPEPYSQSCNGDKPSPNMSQCGHDRDVEVDECVASIDDPSTEDENPESVLQDFNIIKIEEESIPIFKTPVENKSSALLGSFVEEHSETIISQQLGKEKRETLSASNDSSKQTKTTVRILQLPDSKQPVLLRTAENRFTMPVQVKATPGFKLITNSVNPQINVSYMKPAQERPSNSMGVVLSQNSRVGVSVPKVAGIPEKGATILSTVPQSIGTSSNRYLINSTGFKCPVLLSSTPNSTPNDKTAKTQPTCYLVQRSVPFVQAPNSAPGLRLASTQLPLNSRPVLAMPLGSAEKPNPLQGSRQAFLLRYISPPKSGIRLNNQEAKTVAQSSQSNESTGNKVIFKIVTPTGGLLSSTAPVAGNQPLFLATRPQTQCFLVSPNKSNANISSSIKKFIKIAQKDVEESSQSLMNVTVQSHEAEKPILAPRPIRPPSQRKRRRKQLFDELSPPSYKARRLLNRIEKESVVLWKPIAKEVERTLRLAPFSSLQQIKCPRRYQPVVVLNHPDADIPEAANIMRVVNRYRGAVSKVSLSEQTVQALSELGALGTVSPTKGALFQSDDNDPRPRPVRSSVRERFLLKLKLRKKSRKKYEVVKTLGGSRQGSVAFECWFCGRLFNSQEDWIGHGQRHLMEATRDWNKLI